jgi:hypothetical protein
VGTTIAAAAAMVMVMTTPLDSLLPRPPIVTQHLGEGENDHGEGETHGKVKP